MKRSYLQRVMSCYRNYRQTWKYRAK